MPQLTPLAAVLADVKSGFACGEEAPDGVFQIRMNNIGRQGGLNLTKRRRIPADHKAIRSTTLEPGDVLFNATNSPELVGKTALFTGLNETVVFSNHFLRLRADTSKIDPGYLARWLNYQYEGGIFRAMCRQWVNQATVGKDALLRLSIPLVPVERQRSAAALLDDVDGLRVKRQMALALLEQLTWSIFYEMFGAVSDREAWRVLPLDDVAAIQGGLQLSGARKTLPVEVPYLRVANVHRGRLDLGEIKSMRVTESEFRRALLKAGDLLVVEGHGNPAEIGRVAIWDGSIDPCTHQNHLIRARPDQTVVLPDYVCAYMNSMEGRQHLLREARTTSGLNTISVSDVKTVQIPVPPIEDQRLFSERLLHIDQLRKIHERGLAGLDELFSSLRQRAFNGNL